MICLHWMMIFRAFSGLFGSGSFGDRGCEAAYLLKLYTEQYNRVDSGFPGIHACNFSALEDRSLLNDE